MNTASVGLSDFDALGITAVVRSLVTDTDNGAQAIRWLSRGAAAYNPGAGTTTVTETITDLTLFVGPISAKDAGGIQGAKVGDVQVMVDSASLGAPAVDDRFIDAADVVWSVYLVTSSPLPTHALCYARKVS